ncbi:MAG: sulfotransferase [Bacteroidota bacterium]
MATSATSRTQVFGVGLNKTGTKTLRRYLLQWGYRHRTYDSGSTTESPSFDLYRAGRTDDLLNLVADVDSAEDWPWPLLYRDLDARYPEARFVLTVRSSPEVWYRSLCNMAVRIGPLPLFEQTVYGSAMPQGRKAEHLAIYRAHNEAVQAHFADRPGKLLVLCWEDEPDASRLATFLGLEDVDVAPEHANRSPSWVYDGDRLWLAHVHRVLYQRGPHSLGRRLGGRLARLGA